MAGVKCTALVRKVGGDVNVGGSRGIGHSPATLQLPAPHTLHPAICTMFITAIDATAQQHSSI